MILDEIVLHNFGIYRGRHQIELTPSSKNKPIILFGGLNGAGKTTLLDALKLVLYGKQADCSNRRGLSYEDFLHRSIHRDVTPEDGAAIELRFRHRADGLERVYRVNRSWSLKRKHIGEQVEVLLDGKLDPVVTEHWADLVEDFIPARLSQFFFFDGEKIEALADLDHSTEVLATALQSLLGLDLVDQLQTDLKVVERRHKEKQLSREQQEALKAAKAEAERLSAQYDKVFQERASKTSQVQRLRNRVQELEEQFRKSGGELFAKRAELDARRKAIQDKLDHAREQLRDKASEVAPLLLVRGPLDGVAARSSALDVQLRRALVDVLAERDTKLLEEARRTGLPSQALERLERFLQEDREHRQPDDTESPLLQLTARAHQKVTDLRGSLLAAAEASIALLLREIRGLLQDLDAIDRQLEMVPDQEAVGAVSKQISKAQKELGTAEAALELIEEELKRVEVERSRKWDAYGRLMEKESEERFRHDEAERVVQHAQGVRTALEQFRLRMAERHIRRIEQLILEGFQYLLRKESLVSRVTISPDSYHMSLYGVDGSPLSPERLSAGERQLLAVSIIWGLARASGRPLPVVIDTPLGRLDSVHRRHLVERYFPAASHQVLLLSTDEEIDEAELERLKDSVGKERIYNIVYDEQSRSSRVERGYFW